MFDHKHYIPILKARMGELAALRETTAQVRSRVNPLLEVASIPWDFDTDAPAKTIDAHLDGLANKILQAWGTDSPLFVDTVLIPDDLLLANGTHPTEWLFEQFRGLGVSAIPVTGLDRAAAYQSAIRNIAQADGRGACIRIDSDDLEQSQQFAATLPGLLSAVGVDAGNADLLIDFGDLGATQAMPYAIAAGAIIAALPLIADWRTLTLAGSAFPLNLRQFGSMTTTPTPRTDWQIWNQVLASQNLPRLPAFGDYAVQHPEPDEIDPRLMKMAAQLRYARPDDWLIFKWRNVREHGNEQFADICTALVATPDFRGAAFSWGDKYIADCAAGNASHGNAMIWRKVATNHHLAVVAEQIANLP